MSEQEYTEEEFNSLANEAATMIQSGIEKFSADLESLNRDQEMEPGMRADLRGRLQDVINQEKAKLVQVQQEYQRRRGAALDKAASDLGYKSKEQADNELNKVRAYYRENLGVSEAEFNAMSVSRITKAVKMFRENNRSTDLDEYEMGSMRAEADQILKEGGVPRRNKESRPKRKKLRRIGRGESPYSEKDQAYLKKTAALRNNHGPTNQAKIAALLQQDFPTTA